MERRDHPVVACTGVVVPYPLRVVLGVGDPADLINQYCLGLTDLAALLALTPCHRVRLVAEILD